MPRRMLPHVTVMLVVVFVMAVASSAFALGWPTGTHRVALDVTRIGGSDRYATAAALAAASYPARTGVDHVVIASGDPGSYADPLSAGGLCWAYDAPLILVSRDGVPDAARALLAEFAAANGGVDVTIVGGSGAVSEAVAAEIGSIVAPGVVEQPWTVGDRYDTAAGVASRVSEVASDTLRPLPARALIANGSSELGFVDALALSAVSARTGVPIVLVQRDVVPAAAASVLATLPAGDVIVAGGVGAVSESVYALTGGTARWAGPDRFATSVAVAEGARTRGWFTGTTAALAATVPDALTGSVFVAGQSGPVLYTRSEALAVPTAYYLARSAGVYASATILGGTGAISAQQERELTGTPTTPVIVGPADGALVGKKAAIKVRVGVNTSEVRLYAGTTLVATKPATSYATVDFGLAQMPADGVRLRAVAVNPDGGLAESSLRYRRLTYPASTSIVIDKSDFRLYFVKNDVLIETYPIAIGRVGMETPTRLWKINAKYYTDPRGVYGPRKMRLFAQTSSGWAFTAYGIHGTNEPWVIGTKASHGCIRLYNRDILDLFPQVPLGTIVLTRQ